MKHELVELVVHLLWYWMLCVQTLAYVGSWTPWF